MIKWVKVQFQSYNSRKYDYLCDIDVQAGDWLIVRTPYSGLTIVKCSKVYETNPPSSATQKILSKLDLSHIK